MTNQTRKIIHVDMDAFFASVEQRDNPDLKGKPVIVGGLPNSRGVVATCSYEARKYGIHSAMPSQIAFRRCPHAIFIKTNIEKYKAVSKQIMDIFLTFTDLVEPIAFDEAYLDVTKNKTGVNSATIIAKTIKNRIYEETKLTASAGVSYNKFLAKIASGYQKPNGLTIVTPDQAPEFIERLPIGDFFGVGKVTEQKFLDLGIKNGVDLRNLSEEKLIEVFKERGRALYRNVRGIDDRLVIPNRKRKSVGKETTLREDLHDLEDMLPVLKTLAEFVSDKLKSYHVAAKCIVLKTKFHDFTQMTKRVTIHQPTNDASTIFLNVQSLLEKVEFEGKSIRLLGVYTSEFHSTQENKQTPIEVTARYEQLKLF